MVHQVLVSPANYLRLPNISTSTELFFQRFCFGDLFRSAQKGSLCLCFLVTALWAAVYFNLLMKKNYLNVKMKTITKKVMQWKLKVEFKQFLPIIRVPLL